MKVIRNAFLVACTFMAVLPAAAAKTGDRWNNAGSISAGKTKTVTLVPMRDDDGDIWEDSGVYYISFTCSRYKAYTVYTSGVRDDSGVTMGISDITNYKDYGSKDPPYLPWFSESVDRDGNLRAVLTVDDWDEDCAKSGTYYIVLEGDVGTSVTVTLANGAIEEPIPAGIEENPSSLSVPATGTGTRSGRLVDGAYWFVATLTEGKKYTFWTSGGTDDASLDLSISGDTDVDEPDLKSMTSLDDNNTGWIVVPVKTGKHFIVVEGDGNGQFTLNYGAVSARTPADHRAETLNTPAQKGAPVTAGFALGHRNDPNSGFFDQVIDQQLFKVNLTKDSVYVFSATNDKSVPMTMEIYDRSGKVLLSTTAADPLLSFVPAASADYWVGACEALADDENDEPAGAEATLTAVEVAKDAGLRDEWDPMDDTTGEADGLAPKPGAKTGDVVALGDAHGPHTLGVTDWVDTYQIAARKGLTYRLKSSLAEDDANFVADSRNWKLTASVYTFSGATKKAVATIDDLAEGGEFTASAHGTYFIDVAVAGGQGRDYGPYVLHSLACDPNGATLGTLRVEIGGASFSEGAMWSLASDGASAPKYPGGSSVLLPEADYTVKFAAVKNWTTPADVPVTVRASGTDPVSVKYSDTSDDSSDDAKNGDGSMGGKKVTVLKPAKTETTVSRSLWQDDAADWYKFALTANGAYRFTLQESARRGDAEIVVYRENGTDVVAKGTDVSFLCRETKGTYYLCVHHTENTPVDSQYAMTYSMKQVGAVGFAKAALSTKDTSTSIALAVNRANGKDGRVRVQYATRAGTAVPGTHYVPQNGYLEWNDGDTKAKTITIMLLGDLKAKWEADRTFMVDLAVLPAASMESDETAPMLSVATAEVTIQESSKMATGQVAFSAWGDADDDFANAAKPAMACAAGETVRLRLSRTGGSDGKIAVTVTPTKGTALADTHFDATMQTVTWDDGDDADKYVTIPTYGQDEFVTAKAFTVKIAADKTVSGYVPSKIGAAVTVTLGDSDVSQSLADYIAEEKTKGVSVKAGKADTWYVDALGRMRNVELAAGGNASLTYTFKDHGKLAFLPMVVKDDGDASTVVCKIDKETVSLEDGVEVVRYLGKGSHTVAFTVTRDKKSTSAEVYLAIAPQANGSVGMWKSLPLPTRVAPLAPEVALGAYDVFTGSETVTFAWSDAGDPEIAYLFSLDKDAKKLGTANAKIYGSADNYLADPETQVAVFCPSCVTGEPADGMLAESTYSWRVDSAFIEDGAIRLVNTNVAWTVVSAIATAEAGVPAPRPYLAGTDAVGKTFGVDDGFGVPVEVTLVQGMAANLSFGGVNTADGATLTYAIAKGSAALPAGLTLKDGKITGVPSKAGTTTNVVQITQKTTVEKKTTTTVGATVTVVVKVEPINYAEGTFNGLALTEDDRIDATAGARIGSLTFTAAGSGKLSAKAVVGGATYSFAGSGWTEAMTYDNGLPGLKVRLEQVSKMAVGRTSVICTNVLEVTASRAETNDWDGIDKPMTGTLTLSVLAADKQSVISNIVYDVEAVRDFSKVKHVAAAAAAFAGYYTVSLPATDADSETPQGHGYLTMTVSAAGVAKMTAVLADGATKPSLSAVGGYVSQTFSDGPKLRIPVFYGKSPVAFGGWLVLKTSEDEKTGDALSVVDSDSKLLWIDGNVAHTYSGDSGFALELEPTGGYYDTVMNLQTYYLDYVFKVAELDMWSLPEELLGSNESYVAYPGMSGEILSILGNNITADKQVKAMRTDDKKLIDWANTVNPANIALKFTRSTGLYSGSFDLYAGNADPGEETKQVKLGTMKTQGVLLLSRDPAAATMSLEDGVMPGFYVAPVKVEKRTWNASLPFIIVPEAVDNDWSEGLPE